MTKPKFKVGNQFQCLFSDDDGAMCAPYFLKGSKYEIINVVSPGELPTCHCGLQIYVPETEISYVIENIENERTCRIPEKFLSDKKRWKSTKKLYEYYTMSKPRVATAIFEYLEKRGFKPNRKRGIKRAKTFMGGFDVGDYWVEIEETSSPGT